MTNQSKNQSSQIDLIQISRGIAALAVLLFHAGLILSSDHLFGLPEIGDLFAFGDSGVEYFFVLSGFIIYTAHHSQPAGLKHTIEYLKKRFTRIFPIYWIIFIAALILKTLLTGKPTQDGNHLTLIQSFFLIPQEKTITNPNGSEILSVAWSLQYELFFYLVFTLAILYRQLLPIIIASLLLAPAFTALLGPFETKYLFLFGSGVFCGFAANHFHLTHTKIKAALMIGLTTIIILWLDEINQKFFTASNRTYLYGVASFLIIFGLINFNQYSSKSRLRSFLCDLGKLCISNHHAAQFEKMTALSLS